MPVVPGAAHGDPQLDRRIDVAGGLPPRHPRARVDGRVGPDVVAQLRATGVAVVQDAGGRVDDHLGARNVDADERHREREDGGTAQRGAGELTHDGRGRHGTATRCTPRARTVAFESAATSA